MLNLDVKKDSRDLIVKDGITQIPEGYMWCCDCLALTEHIKGEFSYSCIVCDLSIYGYGCPNCGAPDPFDEDPGGPEEVTLHHPGCHCNAFEDEDEEDELRFMSCHVSEAKRVASEFKRDWMKPAPERTSYMLPNDREWYDKYSRLRKIWEEAYNTKCGCPRTLIFRNPQVYNYKSYPIVSFDCMNAFEWDYNVRCPICGCIYEMHDGNC